MKKLQIMFITVTIIVSGLMVPIEPAHALQPYITTKCHYMYYDTEFTELHTELSGDVDCAPFPQGQALRNILRSYGIAVENTAGPNIPESHCRIIKVVFTEY